MTWTKNILKNLKLGGGGVQGQEKGQWLMDFIAVNGYICGFNDYIS